LEVDRRLGTGIGRLGHRSPKLCKPAGPLMAKATTVPEAGLQHAGKRPGEHFLVAQTQPAIAELLTKSRVYLLERLRVPSACNRNTTSFFVGTDPFRSLVRLTTFRCRAGAESTFVLSTAPGPAG
jgi:hypothetical protein